MRREKMNDKSQILRFGRQLKGRWKMTNRDWNRGNLLGIRGNARFIAAIIITKWLEEEETGSRNGMMRDERGTWKVWEGTERMTDTKSAETMSCSQLWGLKRRRTARKDGGEGASEREDTTAWSPWVMTETSQSLSTFCIFVVIALTLRQLLTWQQIELLTLQEPFTEICEHHTRRWFSSRDFSTLWACTKCVKVLLKI